MQISKRFVSIAGAMIIGGLGGCATIFNPGPDKVSVISEPSGATVSIDGAEVGQTPLVTEVSRHAKLMTFKMAGCNDNNMKIDRKLNLWFMGDIVLLSPLGVVIDLCTGDVGEAPKEYHVTLTPTGQATGPGAANAVANR